MKAKLKSANGLVRFLLAHGEKLGIVLLLGLAGMLFYSSLGRDTLKDTQRPTALEQLARSADNHIAQMSWEQFPPTEKVVPPPASDNDAIGKPIDPEQFPQIDPFNLPITPPVSLRQDPVLLALKDLEASGGSGLWAEGDPDELRRMRLEALAQARRDAAEAEAERERMDREADRGGRRRGPGEGERFGPGGGYGQSEFTKSGAAIVRPNTGAMTQGGGIEIIKSRSWVVVNGVVPLKAQFEAYKSVLENARGYSQSDFPEYYGYQVERAEATPDGLGPWKLLGSYRDKSLIDQISAWPVQTPEVVNQKYVHPLLTFPLPPMMLRQWGDEVTHSSMPIPTPEELMAEQGFMGEGLPGETPPGGEESAEPDDPADPFSRPDPREMMRRQMEGPMGGRTGSPYGGEFGRGGGRMEGPMGMGRGSRFGDYGGGEFGGRGGGRGEFGSMMGMGGGYGMSDTGLIQLPPYVWDYKTKNLLFRFFDTTVVPGGRYKYRIRLVLTDPNAYMPPKYLAKEVSARLKSEGPKPRGFRYTEWSEPSATAVVPPPGLIFIAGGSPANPNNIASEPEATLIVKTLDAIHAAEAAIKVDFTRGSVINLYDFAKVIWSNTFSTETTPDEPKFDFRTGVTLLDVRGGGRLAGSRDLNGPVRTLLMDSGGRLTVKDELDDFEVVREYNYISEAAEQARRAARDGGGGGGGGRGGPEGGGRGGRGF